MHTILNTGDGLAGAWDEFNYQGDMELKLRPFPLFQQKHKKKEN